MLALQGKLWRVVERIRREKEALQGCGSSVLSYISDLGWDDSPWSLEVPGFLHWLQKCSRYRGATQIMFLGVWHQNSCRLRTVRIKCLLCIHRHIATCTLTNNVGTVEIMNELWTFILLGFSSSKAFWWQHASRDCVILENVGWRLD